MRNLQNVISDYLSKPTDFAVQIVGSWGYGKTYYYRKILEPLICGTSTVTKANKNYKPVYISLFGLKSVEDISTKIVMDFYQSKYFKAYFSKRLFRKRLKITQSILKIGLRGFLNFKRLGNVNEYLTDIKTIGENVLDTNELIICFDDLERKDTALKIEDLTGYINSLVDEGIKVLIISNDDLLLKDGDTYKNLKEKIIGISVEFVPNVKETLGNIIKEKYSTFPVYSKYLTENIDALITLSKATDNNFRHIIYALGSLHHCYSILKNKIIDCNHEINERLQIELKNISYLTIALAIEYKSSTLKFSDLKDYSHEHLSLQELFAHSTQSKSTIVNKDKFDLFLEKYDIQKEDYRLYNSIFNYVTAYDEFNIDNFIVEFKKIFKLDNGKVVPEYEILHSLSYTNCFNLTDEEYREKTMAIIQFAENGKYLPIDYLSVMHYCERLDNVLGLNLEEVKDKLVAGLTKQIKSLATTGDISFSQFEMSGRMSEISKINKQLYKAGMAEIKLFQEKQIKDKIEATAELLTKDIAEFENLYRTDGSFKSNLSYYSFLNYLNIEKFVEKLKTSDSQTIFFLRHFFKDRYENISKLEDEFENFKKFTRLLTNYRDSFKEEEENKIRKYVVTEFVESLNELIKKGDQAFAKKIIEA
jgi:hypothetical protein